MPEQNDIGMFLDAFARVLLRCLLLGAVLLVMWFGIYALAGDWVLRIHGTWFDLTKHELDLIHYCGMGMLKLGLLLFFLLPCIAIRLVLRDTRR